MTLHYWEEIIHNGFSAYKCGWCGLVRVVPRIVRDLKSIKPDDDNFDITCALSQGVSTGSVEHYQLSECPVRHEKKKRYNKAIEKAEAELLESIVLCQLP